MNFRKHRRENLEISMTPMVDVVLCLLIFFMVTTTFSRYSELQIQLPEAKGQETLEKHMIEINVDPEGNYYVNQHQVVNRTMEMLKKAILDAAKGKDKPTLVIAADQNATHQAVINVLDAAKQLDFIHVTFATKTSPESQE
ncbi:MAG: biopolymer transporter ExbD [Methylococcaceae bacterium]|nr:biopolymer transporter ExbD [Methylococcaceae bacterium]MCI0732600.1 biopolymer transporter ExbD [Methylococcaceae bacterium]